MSATATDYVLALATLGCMTQVGSFLFVSCHPRCQGKSIVVLLCVDVTGNFALNISQCKCCLNALKRVEQENSNHNENNGFRKSNSHDLDWTFLIFSNIKENCDPLAYKYLTTMEVANTLAYYCTKWMKTAKKFDCTIGLYSAYFKYLLVYQNSDSLPMNTNE